MKIGLIDVDGHARKKQFGATVYPNLALCKISAYHKSMGDIVTWYDPLFTGHCDIVYVSKIFNFSPDLDFYIDADVIKKGGTGYDIESQLPAYIDCMRPDYDIYELLPKNNAYGFLTRGCPNACSWCVVPRKEGKIRPYMDVDEIATPTRTNLILMDNNILAAGDYAKEQFAKIIARGYRVDFNQAIDARLMTMDFAELMVKMKWIDRRIRFGCDTPKQIQECQRSISMLERCGFRGEFMIYTILNNNFVESYDRVHFWWDYEQETRKGEKRCHVYPNAQPYLNPNKTNTPPSGKKIWPHGSISACCLLQWILEITNRERVSNANITWITCTRNKLRGWKFPTPFYYIYRPKWKFFHGLWKYKPENAKSGTRRVNMYPN